jgi:hypothetical protein
MFGPNYMEFDNSEDLRTAPPEVVKAKKEEMLQLFTNVKSFVAAKPTSDSAKEWIANELGKKDTLPIKKGGAEKVAHPDSGAAEKARKLGLQYYGFGRYGQNGVVTHHSVHDELIEIPKDKSKEIAVPISGSSMGKPESKKVNEDFESLLEEDDVEIFSEEKEKKDKLLKSYNGKTKIFLLRRSAAEESHTNGGTVIKHPKGYVIKIKEENDNVDQIAKLTEDKDSRNNTNSNTRTSSITEASSQEGGNEQPRTKITLAEIRKRKEAQVGESIDMGIEPGISMAASGENLRSTVRKKRIEELTGDETTLSNSAQVEDELKRKGINLKSFKASRYGSF